MTAVIAYRDPSGEILIAADSRISWVVPGSATASVRVDHLQKIYPIADNIVLAFTTNDIRTVQKVLTSTKAGLKFSVKTGSIVQDSYKNWNSVKRAIKRYSTGLHPSTEFVLAQGVPGHPNSNRLAVFRFSQKKFIAKEITDTNFRILGSAQTETDFARFEDTVVKPALQPTNGTLPLFIKYNLLQSLDSGFRSSLAQQWKSVGEVFYGVYTEDGIWQVPSTSTTRMNPGNRVQSILIEFDQASGSFRQINQSTGKAMPLIRVDKFNFKTVPGQSDVFSILPR